MSARERDERYCRWLARYFVVEGMGREDLAQEARLAMWLAPAGARRTAARRRMIDLLRSAQRRPRFAELVEVAVPDTTVDVVDARARLRAIVEVEADLTANERIAVGRRLRGEPIRRGEHALDVAWFRARRRLAGA